MINRTVVGQLSWQYLRAPTWSSQYSALLQGALKFKTRGLCYRIVRSSSSQEDAKTCRPATTASLTSDGITVRTRLTNDHDKSADGSLYTSN